MSEQRQVSGGDLWFGLVAGAVFAAVGGFVMSAADGRNAVLVAGYGVLGLAGLAIGICTVALGVQYGTIAARPTRPE